MKTVGMSSAGGVGLSIAEVITQGYTRFDTYELDINRFLGLHNNRKFLRDRVREVPGKIYIEEDFGVAVLIAVFITRYALWFEISFSGVPNWTEFENVSNISSTSRSWCCFWTSYGL